MTDKEVKQRRYLEETQKDCPNATRFVSDVCNGLKSAFRDINAEYLEETSTHDERFKNKPYKTVYDKDSKKLTTNEWFLCYINRPEEYERYYDWQPKRPRWERMKDGEKRSVILLSDACVSNIVELILLHKIDPKDYPHLYKPKYARNLWGEETRDVIGVVADKVAISSFLRENRASFLDKEGFKKVTKETVQNAFDLPKGSKFYKITNDEERIESNDTGWGVPYDNDHIFVERKVQIELPPMKTESDRDGAIERLKNGLSGIYQSF